MRLVLDFPWLSNKTDQLSQLLDECKSPEEFGLIDSLIRQFKFVDSAEMQETLSKIATFIETLGAAEDIIICATAVGSQPDGSQMIINMLKNRFSHAFLEKVKFCNTLNNLKRKIEDRSIVILVDDFIGTGQTLSGRLTLARTQISEHFKGLQKDPNHKYYACAPAGMKSGVASIENLFDGFLCENCLKKGISDNFPKNCVQKNIDIMLSIEARLHPKVMGKNLPNLGYGKAEALYAFSDINIPNSVFPWFWWPKFVNEEDRPILFRRAEL